MSTHHSQAMFGLHAVQALLEKHPERVLSLHVMQTRGDKKMEALLSLAKIAGIHIETTSRQALDKLAQEGNHQGVIALCAKAKAYQESDLKSFLEQIEGTPFLLILDGVQDPHNLGACFRSADAAGVHAIIAPKDKSVGITPVVSKVACGAAETLPFIQVTNLARSIETVKEHGIWVYGAAGEATKTIYQTDLKGPLALVMGAEGSGLRRLTRDLCDGLINIPMVGTVESLNVSVATGICLFEALRQRL